MEVGEVCGRAIGAVERRLIRRQLHQVTRYEPGSKPKAAKRLDEQP